MTHTHTINMPDFKIFHIDAVNLKQSTLHHILNFRSNLWKCIEWNEWKTAREGAQAQNVCENETAFILKMLKCFLILTSLLELTIPGQISSKVETRPFSLIFLYIHSFKKPKRPFFALINLPLKARAVVSVALKRMNAWKSLTTKQTNEKREIAFSNMFDHSKSEKCDFSRIDHCSFFHRCFLSRGKCW